MQVIIVILVALIVGAGSFVGGTYYGEKVEKAKKEVGATATVVASTATIGTRASAVSSATAVTSDGIKVTSPQEGATISSPLTISGEAVGSWYFEGEFNVSLTDANGAEVASVIVKANGDWMTENYVPFSATMQFKKQLTPFGYLIFKSSNPSGQPAGDKEFKVKVMF